MGRIISESLVNNRAVSLFIDKGMIVIYLFISAYREDIFNLLLFY